MKTRICSACGEPKPRSEFYGDGKRCKTCIFSHKSPQFPGVRVRCFSGVPVDFAGFPKREYCQKVVKVVLLERV